MESEPTITQAERIDHGVMIAFSDGRAALFSAAFLYANIASAAEVYENGGEEADEPED